MKGYIIVSKEMESLLGENIQYKKNVTHYRKGKFSKHQNNFKVFKSIEDIQLFTSVYKNRVFEVATGTHVYESDTCYYTNSITLLDEVKYDMIFKYLYDNKDRLSNSENYVHKLILIEFGIIPYHLFYDESPIVKYNAIKYSDSLPRTLFWLKRLGKYPRGLAYFISRNLKKLKPIMHQMINNVDNKIYYRLFS